MSSDAYGNWDNPNFFGPQKNRTGFIGAEHELLAVLSQVLTVQSTDAQNHNTQTAGGQNTYKIMPRITNSGFRQVVVAQDYAITQSFTHEEVQHYIQEPFGSRLF